MDIDNKHKTRFVISLGLEAIIETFSSKRASALFLLSTSSTWKGFSQFLLKIIFGSFSGLLKPKSVLTFWDMVKMVRKLNAGQNSF